MFYRFFVDINGMWLFGEYRGRWGGDYVGER